MKVYPQQQSPAALRKEPKGNAVSVGRVGLYDVLRFPAISISGFLSGTDGSTKQLTHQWFPSFAGEFRRDLETNLNRVISETHLKRPM